MPATPEFFLPYAENNDVAEKQWQKLRQQQGGGDKRIYSVTWRHKGVTYEAEVGKTVHHLTEDARPVMAIFKGLNCYKVCTVYGGVVRDVPIMSVTISTSGTSSSRNTRRKLPAQVASTRSRTKD